MGEKEEARKNEGEKKADSGKKDDVSNVVLKLDMHCEGCAKKLKKFIRNMDGVENVKAECETSKLTIEGKVDPTRIRDRLAEKTNKKVEIISSSQPKKEGSGEKKPDEKDKQPEKPKDEPKKEEGPKATTVIFKIRLHCEGCIGKIRKIIKKFKGVQVVTIDGANDLVTVMGTMDVKAFQPYLKEKLRRDVELVQPKKDNPPAGGGGEKKDEKSGGGEKKDEKSSGGGEKKEEKSGGGGEKKDKEISGGGGEKKEEGSDVKVEVNKMDHGGYPQMATTSYWYGGPSYYGGNPQMGPPGGYPPMGPGGYMPMGPGGYMPMGPGQAPVQGPNVGYVVEQFHAPYFPQPYHEPGIFSDENPNGCFIM